MLIIGIVSLAMVSLRWLQYASELRDWLDLLRFMFETGLAGVIPSEIIASKRLVNIPMNSTNFLEQRIKNKRINCEKSTELWEFAIIIMQFFSSVLCCGISISFVHTSETASSFLLLFFSIYGAKTPQDVGNWINTNEKKNDVNNGKYLLVISFWARYCYTQKKSGIPSERCKELWLLLLH